LIEIFSREWFQDVIQGRGSLHKADGTIASGEWIKNNLVNPDEDSQSTSVLLTT